MPGCPVLALTGLPCPTCGATRGVSLLFEGDPAFLRYNAFWAVAIALAAAWGVLALWRGFRGRPLAGPVLAPVAGRLRASPAAIVALTATLAVAGWITAMVNLETIRPL